MMASDRIFAFSSRRMASNRIFGFEPNRLSFIFNNMVASNRIFAHFFDPARPQCSFGRSAHCYTPSYDNRFW